MERYYDITIKYKDKKGSISYWADSFSVDKNGILRIKSVDCGDVTVHIKTNENLSVCSVDVKDEYDEMMEHDDVEEENG